jgi:MtaA/CmuA family methyltransferase
LGVIARTFDKFPRKTGTKSSRVASNIFAAQQSHETSAINVDTFPPTKTYTAIEETSVHPMTGRERILALLHGQKVDHLHSMPITMMFAADVLGIRYGAYVRDHNLLVAAQMKTAEIFGFDHISTISDPAREAADYGAHIQWYDDQPPAILEDDALFADKRTLHGFKIPDLQSGGRREDRIRGVELLRRRVDGELLIEGWVEGPCAEGSDLRGIKRLMMDFFDDPSFVRDQCDLVVEGAVPFAAAQIQAGADIIGIGDAAASLVGPRIYKEFVWPSEKRLIGAIHGLGGKVRLHICGNTRRILTSMGELEADIVDLDFPVALQQAREEMGRRQTLAGNLDPLRDVRNGSPEPIAEALEELQQHASERWIVAGGCEIVRDTPHCNVQAFSRFAQTHAAAFSPA